MPLYPYQERVKDLIKSGKSVILQAPTGAGKTRAALAPFIESFFELPPEAFPRKCIYSVPMRVLANQFMADYTEYSEKYRRVHRRKMFTSIQTGDRPTDQKLESNLIFATVDQTLSSFFNIPYSLGKASANLNAGAVMSSYLVFDELHLYEPDTMLPSVLGMLRWLKDVAPFVVMTATFSTKMLQRLADWLGAKVVPEDEKAREAMENLGSQVGKQRIFRRVDGPLTAAAVLDSERQGRRVICICNTVRRAQELFLALKQELQARGDRETQLRLIHSRFYKQHRDAKEDWIRTQFGIAQSKYDGPPLILVATQVIEVGVDATSDVLHTELAPAASILQRAGRCARRENESGQVFVYLPCDDNGAPDFVPYFLPQQPHKTARGKRLCEATWETLALSQFQNVHMSFGLEQQWIDAVHTPIDQEILDEMESNYRRWMDKALAAMREQDYGLASELIRDADTRFICVHPDPKSDEALARNPWHYDGFALQPGSLARAFAEVDKTPNSEAPWVMRQAQLRSEAPANEELPARQIKEYDWPMVTEANQVFSAIALAVHPRYALYDEGLGFRFGLSSHDTHELQVRPNTPRPHSYSYHCETYAEHIAGLYRAYQQSCFDAGSNQSRLPLVDEMAYAACQLREKFGLQEGVLDAVVRLMLACHDLGKLSMRWQDWAYKWQAKVGKFYAGKDMRLPKDYLAAHTDFEPTKAQKEAQRQMGKRPHHAGESAIAAATLVQEAWGDHPAVCQALLTAIARHHHAATDNYVPYESHSGAERAFEEALKVVGLEPIWAKQVWWKPDGSEILRQLLIDFDPSTKDNILLYFFFSRLLRMTDQRSQMS